MSPEANRKTMRRRLAALLVVAACLGAAPGVAAAQSGSLADLAAGVEPVAVLVTVQVGASGDATWQVRYVVALDDENATDAFADFQADVAADPATYREQFAERIRETVRDAENATGREMAASSFAMETQVDPFTEDQGFVTYTFTWEGFAVVDGPQLRTGDAVEGLFLDTNTTLTVAWPDGYQPTAIRPQPDEELPTEATWVGERNFGPGEPSVVVSSAASGATTPAGADSGDIGQLGAAPAALGAVTLVAMVITAFLWRRRARRAGIGEQSAELLSNEERVLRLLESRGGRVKQQDVVEATGWSEMKTSQVVSGMRDDGTVEAFRLGRENVISLPDYDNT